MLKYESCETERLWVRGEGRGLEKELLRLSLSSWGDLCCCFFSRASLLSGDSRALWGKKSLGEYLGLLQSRALRLCLVFFGQGLTVKGTVLCCVGCKCIQRLARVSHGKIKKCILVTLFIVLVCCVSDAKPKHGRS